MGRKCCPGGATWSIAIGTSVRHPTMLQVVAKGREVLYRQEGDAGKHVVACELRELVKDLVAFPAEKET